MQERRDLWWECHTKQLGAVVHLDLPEPFECDYGGELESIQVSYETWGELNATGDNAVLLVHPMTSDCHATGSWVDQPRGWWEDIVGPGKAIDTDQCFVVCPNLLGGCFGTTGPRFLDPEGKTWYDRFPLLTPRDMMRVQKLFLDAIGIGRLRTVIGASMGGMLAWEWAIEHSDMLDRAVVVAAPLVTTAHQIAMNWLQRRGIELDITENEVVARWGQMVARGVGMLSYRSPVGLEAKFGRSWFKQPGSTLGDRGMFNIESWLRMHGRRISKRYDPYTYLLYSRAMDLHDVARDRGDVVAALDRVRCRVVVMGISTDFLYPPEQVHLGADLLDHLGRDVRYGEIRTPHGHDGFLLETEQVSDILRATEHEGVRRVPTRVERSWREVRVGVLGGGKVGTSFARLLAERADDLAAAHDLRFRIAAVADINPDLSFDPIFDRADRFRDAESVVRHPDVDVVVELTRGSDVSGIVREALERGKPVVTPHKALIRHHGDELGDVALRNGVRLAYHDSIAAGWPLMHSVERPLANSEVTAIRAVLSVSCNRVLERMAAGAEYAEALADVVAMGVTELDPELDTSGWDSAQKLSILVSHALRRRYGLEQVALRGVHTVTPALVQAAETAGYRVRMVAAAFFGPGCMRVTVGPVAVRPLSHMGSAHGSNNVVVLQTRDEGEMVFIGDGSGTIPVATAVINDLVGVYDVRYSWTGRFPQGTREISEVRFDRYLHAVGDLAEIVDHPIRGSVPLLST